MGAKNPLTEVLEEAEKQIRLLEAAIVEEYGTPLYYEEKTGDAAFEWPSDPEAISPEEMQVLISIHGEESVNAWLMEHYMTKAQQEQVDAESETEVPDES